LRHQNCAHVRWQRPAHRGNGAAAGNAHPLRRLLMSVFESIMATQIQQSVERRIDGIVAAKVASIDQDGSYRLEYLSMGDGQSSSPARVMMPMAGNKRGMHFLPEPG